MLICSAIVPVLLSFDTGSAIKVSTTGEVLVDQTAGYWKLAALWTSALVAVLTGIRQSYKFNERVTNFRRGAELLKLEGSRYLALTEDYKDMTHSTALPVFINKIAKIRNKQVHDYLQQVVQNTEKENAIAQQVKTMVEKDKAMQLWQEAKMQLVVAGQQQALQGLMKKEIDAIYSADKQVSFALLDHMARTVTFNVVKPGYQPLKEDNYAFRHPLLKGITYDVLITNKRLTTHVIHAGDTVKNKDNADSNIGAVGCICNMGMNIKVFVTCFHVVKSINASWVYDYHHGDVVQLPGGIAGRISTALRTDDLDVAIIKLSSDTQYDPVLPSGAYIHDAKPLTDDDKSKFVQLVSRTRDKDVFYGTIVEVKQKATFDYDAVPGVDEHELLDLIHIKPVGKEPFSVPGDSGSLIFDIYNNAIGMIVGGTTEEAFAIPFAYIQQAFALQQIKHA